MQKKVMKKLAALSGNLPKLLKANTDYEQSRTLLRYAYRITLSVVLANCSCDLPLKLLFSFTSYFSVV